MTFLIDIGNVLLDFNFTPSFQALMDPDVTDGAERMERLIERKDEFEAGKIEVAEYRTWAMGVLGFTGPEEVFDKYWCEIFTPNQPMWNLCRRLKEAGHRLIIFSNTNALHGPYVLEKYPEFSLFDHLGFSYQIGSIKPEQAIFDHMCETYALVPEDTIYIDDLPANIEAGKRSGFSCFTYDSSSHSASLSGLAERLRFDSV